jgi:hypothetical protein
MYGGCCVKLKPIILLINIIGFFVLSIFSNYESTFGRFVGGIVIFWAFFAAKISTFSKLLACGLKMLLGGCAVFDLTQKI